MRTGLLALAALSACATAAPAHAPDYLTDTEWVRVDDADASPHNPTMRFTGAMVGGFTGCRAFAGGVVQRGDTVRFDVAAARPGCNSAEAAEAADRSFLAALAATRHLQYEGAVLVLLDESRRPLARFENLSQ